jgi:hypothetical protein
MNAVFVFVSERIAPDEAQAQVRELVGRMPGTLAARVKTTIGAWPPEDPLSRGYDVIELTGKVGEKHRHVLWTIAGILHRLKAWLDYEAGATAERDRIDAAAGQLARCGRSPAVRAAFSDFRATIAGDVTERMRSDADEIPRRV